MSPRIRFRPRITKKHVFFLPSARIRLLPISGKNSKFREIKKQFEKNKFISRDKKYFCGYVFFACFFLSPSLTLFLNRSKVFFILSPSLFQKYVQCFLYLVALINFSKNMFNVFFLNVFFPPSLDFGFFVIKNRENKQSGLWSSCQNQLQSGVLCCIIIT